MQFPGGSGKPLVQGSRAAAPGTNAPPSTMPVQKRQAAGMYLKVLAKEEGVAGLEGEGKREGASRKVQKTECHQVQGFQKASLETAPAPPKNFLAKSGKIKKAVKK